MMPMTFHEVRNGMTVMDGRRCVAVARGPKLGGVWMLTLRGGAWVDTMTNERKLAQCERMGTDPKISAHLKVVRNRTEARRELRRLAQG